MPKLHCVWWNAKNLFPYVPGETGSHRPASEAHYQQKLQDLAGVLSGMDGGVPDLLFLCEVAVASGVRNRDALGDLCQTLGGGLRHYLAPYGDARGITCGVIWDPGRVTGPGPLATPPLHDVLSEHKRRLGRPILQLTFTEPNTATSFVAYVNHWTSRISGRANSDHKRRRAADELLDLVRGHVVRTSDNPGGDPDALVLAVGDFNDEPFNAALTDPDDPDCNQRHLAISRDRTSVLDRKPAAIKPVLYNPTWCLLGEPLTRVEELAANRNEPPGSHLWTYGSSLWWNTMDQVLVSAGMLAGPDPIFDEGDLAIHAVAPLVDRDGWSTGNPSDHFPMCFALDFSG